MFPTSRKLFFLSPFWTVLSEIHRVWISILNAFFVRQASQSALDGEPPPIDAAPFTEDSQLLVSYTISLSDVERALNARKAPGFDGIPTRLLAILKDEIVHCVHHIFTLSLTSGTLPTDWKAATVTPIYKERGNRQVATNYRPISLLSVLSKCLEKLVFKTLYSHLDQFLPIHQSGFRQRDSTAYQLARLVHRLATAGDEGNTTLACFYDLSKAFDRVWHKDLLAKLHHFGVRSHALAWITDYLSDRRQCVRIATQHHRGSLCRQGFLKAQSWDHSVSSWHTQLISRIVYDIQPNVTNLQTTLH